MMAPAFRRTVQLLDPHTVNQIAAGEVVERPASAVKELVENALDAGARRVVVELEEAGTRRIRVSDDGCGMSEADALAALQRHATSKIRTVEDLQKVSSLGFRGEAIPSIASVSLFSLSAGEEDGSRTVIEVEGGTVRTVRHEAGPRGATITVDDLFYNTPARLKFLKSATTEMSQITEIMGKYAVSYPEVAFRLIHGGQTLLETPGDGDALNAVAAVWGRDCARALAEVDGYREGVRVRGFVSAPHFTKPTRSQQWLFVNGRPVKNRGLFAAVDTAYRQLTPEKRYPVALLMLDVDPAKVDMNVSPTKSECRFAHERDAFDAVRTAIKDALLRHGMMPSLESVIRANEALRPPGQGQFLVAEAPGQPHWGGGGGSVGGGVSGGVGGGLAEAVRSGLAGPLGAGATYPDPAPELTFADRFLQGLRVIGQTADAFFIIAENAEGLMVIDQHVAHERILFERLRTARGKAEVETQALLTPLPLDLDRRQADLMRSRLEEFAAMGFDLEPFGPTSYLVRSAPAALKGADPVAMLRDLMDELLEGAGAMPSWVGGLSPREQIWVMCSCKMAIKAGDRLGMAEMEKLLFDLAQTENPYLCPHGRPITITLGKSELLRRFKRA